MILLSITGLLRTVLVLVLLYYGIKMFSKYVLPSLIMEEKSKSQQGNTTKTKIKETQNHKQVIPDDEGEYVDFEEIKNK
ncbi:MAG: DUF4834 family protein [Bacteroidales bacterium]